MDTKQGLRKADELFMRSSSSSDQPETPTVGPLRINKAASPASSPPPTITHFPPPPNNYIKPPTSPPNRPLPYPDDAPSRQQVYTPQSDGGASGSTTSTPAEGLKRHSSGAHPPSLSPRLYSTSPPSSNSQYSAYQRPPEPSANKKTGPTAYPGAEAEKEVVVAHGATERTRTSPQPPTNGQYGAGAVSSSSSSQYQYPTPPSTMSNNSNYLRMPAGQGVNRLDSTASFSTTRGNRGSPPPPETPVDGGTLGGGIEARYAAAGIAGQSTLNSIQARQYQYQSPPTSGLANAQSVNTPTSANHAQQQTPTRSWTPSEQPGSGPLPTFQGNSESYMAPHDTAEQSSAFVQRPAQETPLEQDMQHLQVSDEPPPAYSSVGQPQQGYPNEKGQYPAQGGPGSSSSAQVLPTPTSSVQTGHPAFANDANGARSGLHSPQPLQIVSSPAQHMPQETPPSPQKQPQSSPPPLPEGWIAHMDPNSGQYYYIHLPTQSTQWEFPTGPTPLSLNEPPLSPTGTLIGGSLPTPTIGKTSFGQSYPQSIVSDGRTSVMNMNSVLSPTAAGFTGLPPNSGVEMYKVAPTNGVYFGPYLRYTNMDADSGIWFGSILIVTDGPNPPTIHIHQSSDLSPDPRQLKANHIYQHQRWLFYRYDIDLRMDDDHDTKWTYAVTSHLGCTRYEFLVAARLETSWRFIAHSGNDFSLNVNANERIKMGGVSFMWRDIMQKHQEVGGFHVQLGMGNQVNADRVWKEVPSLRQWTGMSGKDARKAAPWTAAHEEDVTHAYFHYYTSHFDQPHLREAFAQIPHVLTLDDHDIFDGFGSYPEHMQFSNMFKNIGRIGIELYLLFQHHTTLEILRNVNNDLDLFTVTGTGWHFLKYLGPAVVVVGPDCRSERNPHQVMAGPTYQGIFPKVAVLPPNVQHCIWMIPVPLVYPRLEAAEQFAKTFATGKKAATGSFNALGKVAGGVAGIVGAKGVVNEGFNSVKKAVGKSGLMSSVINPFGELDLLDELRDQWTHESKDLERTYIIRTLQGIAHKKSLRMTFLSGAMRTCGAGMLHDPSHPSDHKTMYQLITSSVVDAPPSSYVLKLLHPNSHSSGNKPLYLPQNGQRTSGGANGGAPTDTKEDMVELFATDVNGQPREMKRLMGRRNYAVCVSYDPQVVQGAFGAAAALGTDQMGSAKQRQMSGRVSLAVDFFVQADSAVQQGMPGMAATVAAGSPATVKYGPLIVPGLDYGR